MSELQDKKSSIMWLKKLLHMETKSAEKELEEEGWSDDKIKEEKDARGVKQQAIAECLMSITQIRL